MKYLCFSFCIVISLLASSASGSEEGMPQLNPEFWAAQVFWLILIFSSLYLMIWKIFLPKITYSIENRKSRIVNDLQEAQKLKENAEKKLLEYNKIIENSKKTAKKLIEESKKKLDQDIKNKRQKFNTEIENELAIVEKEIKMLKKSSIKSISKIATETTSEIIRQIIGNEINQSSVSAIVDEVIKKRVEKNT